MVAGPFGSLETLTRGKGAPHTVFVHGLGGSIATTRPYAGRTPGERTFMHIAGHGRSAPPPELTYPALASEVWAVADDAQANAAVGISMGAGALCSGLSADPHRFAAVVLVLAAALDRRREDKAMAAFAALARVVQTGDSDAVAAHLLAMEPADVADSTDLRRWCADQAAHLVSGAAGAALETMPHQVPVARASALAAVDAPVLVIAQTDDPVHPVSVSHELAQVLPRARLEVLGAGGIIWAHRARVAALVGDFLAEHAS